jgi:hypothetical protein
MRFALGTSREREKGRTRLRWLKRIQDEISEK